MANVEKTNAGNKQVPASQKENSLTLTHLRSLSPVQVADDPLVANKFIDIYMKVHGVDRKQAELTYNSEVFYYRKQLQENPVLQECTQLSLYGAFLDVAVNHLSFDPTKKLAYLLSRKTNVAPKGQQPQWERRCYMVATPDGEVYIRQRTGQIKHCDNPVIVYEGDSWEILSDQRGTVINYAAKLPRAKGARIVGGFIRIIRADGSFDFHYMLQEDIDRLKAYSAKQNAQYVDDGNGGKKKIAGKPNELYTSGPDGQIDTGMLEAKLKKHAFDSYPRAIKGNFAATQAEADKVIETDIYGIAEIASGEAEGKSTGFDEHVEEEQAQNFKVETTTEDEETGY